MIVGLPGIGEVRGAVGPLWFLVAVASLVTGWLLVLRSLRRAGGPMAALAARLLTGLGLSLALAGIAALTLFGTADDGVGARLFLDPRAGARGWAGIAWRPVIDNVTLFVPLGAALAAAWTRRRPHAVLLAAVLVSVAVEAFQWAVPSGRIANSADVLANTVGAALGIGLALATGVRRAAAPRR